MCVGTIPGSHRFEREFLGAPWLGASHPDFVLIITAAGPNLPVVNGQRTPAARNTVINDAIFFVPMSQIEWVPRWAVLVEVTSYDRVHAFDKYPWKVGEGLACALCDPDAKLARQHHAGDVGCDLGGYDDEVIRCLIVCRSELDNTRYTTPLDYEPGVALLEPSFIVRADDHPVPTERVAKIRQLQRMRRLAELFRRARFRHRLHTRL